VFRRALTILVGANGSGKSTILRTIAASLGLPLAGGSMEEAALPPSARLTLGDGARASWRARPNRRDFFSGDNVVALGNILQSRVPGPDFWPGDPRDDYGGHYLHVRSHGQGVTAMLDRSLRADFLLLDEPETALAPPLQLRLSAQLWRATDEGAQQVVLATHAAVFLRIPGAQIVELGPAGPRHVTREETALWQAHERTVRLDEAGWESVLGGVLSEDPEPGASDAGPGRS
jgi:predicted ATPase